MSVMTLDIVPDDLRNCILKDRITGTEVYTIHSAHPHNGNTTITRTHDSHVIATVHYHDLRIIPDKIQLEDHSKVSIRKWLKPSAKIGSLPVNFEEHGEKYTVSELGGKLILSTESATKPIAVFEGLHQPIDHSGDPHKAHITFAAEALEIQDTAVIALVVVAERQRTSDRGEGPVGMAGAPWTVVGPTGAGGAGTSMAL